jgi:hypothetical protein
MFTAVKVSMAKAISTKEPTDSFSLIFPTPLFLPEDGSRIQLPKDATL